MYFSDIQGALVHIVCVDTTGARYITRGLEQGTYQLLDLSGGAMVFTVSHPSQAPVVVSGCGHLQWVWSLRFVVCGRMCVLV